jgi:hypothetical protein
MHDAQKTSSVEQRRKLLKGALAASGVVTMGYSGSALASFACVTTTTNPPTVPIKVALDGSATWAWKELPVYTLTSNSALNGVDIGGVIYIVDLTVTPPTLTLAASTETLNTGVPSSQSVFVLAYFDSTGAPTGVYNGTPAAGSPAAASCLTSINAGVTGDYTYGG